MKAFHHIAFILFVTAASSTNAQLREVPLHVAAKKSSPAARPEDLSPMPLPFWDDFSFTSPGYPNDTLWVNSTTVQVSSGMGIHTPTINVATFDGRDANGVPYNPNDILINGFTDSLISRPIRLGDVLPQNHDSVYLSFYYQWRGNGEAPDPTDFLRLEFRNDQNHWVSMLTIQSEGELQNDTVYSAMIKVPDGFFHDNFQFRFRTYGRLAGPYDTWNVDYVYLDEHRYATDTSYPDRAIASAITHLFDPYSAIPIAHFFNTPALNQPQFDVYNLHSTTITTLSYLPSGIFENYKDGVATKTVLALGDTTPINVTNGIIPPKQRRTVTLQNYPDPGNPSQFDPDADSIRVRLRARLFSGDVVNIQDGQPSPDYKPRYQPIDFRSNDTTSTSFMIKDYYAYDDGSAEYAAGLTQPGNLAALRYVLTSAGGDTLTGLSIHYPYFGGASSTTMEFFIYDNDGGVPGNILNEQLIPVKRSGTDVFIHIPLLQHVVVPHTFYLGWQEPVNGSVYIGLDKSNDTADKIFINTNGPWEANTDVHGSLMLRPIFGKGSVVTAVSAEREEVRIYPNPNNGSFYIEGTVENLEVVAVDGRRCKLTVTPEDRRSRIVLSNCAPGLYIVRYQTSGGIKSKRLAITD